MIKKAGKNRTAEQWIGTNCATRLTVDLPDDLHAKFKAIMATKRMKMSAWVIKTITTYVEKNGDSWRI